MKKGVIFIAGVYGVGKSTLCHKLSEVLLLPEYSASDLIASGVGESYGSNKFVKDKNLNQRVLISEVSALLQVQSTLLLAGHFCILNREHKTEPLPDFIFKSLHIICIILLEADYKIIMENLNDRDGKIYYESEIIDLLNTERQMAINIATNLDIPLFSHTMSFDDSDIDNISDFLKRKVVFSE